MFKRNNSNLINYITLIIFLPLNYKKFSKVKKAPSRIRIMKETILNNKQKNLKVINFKTQNHNSNFNILFEKSFVKLSVK